MRRGTTPTIVLTIDSNYDVSKATDIWATFEQTSSGVELTRKWERYADSNEGISVDGQNVIVTLSQEETLDFTKGNVQVQVKLKQNDYDDGTIYDEVVGTIIKKIKVEEILSEDVM